VTSHQGVRRGRPRGPTTVPQRLRLYPDQKRDLEILREILDGRPPLNGLMQDAVQRYIESKLQDPAIRAEYERRVKPRLHVLSRRSRRIEHRS